MSDSSAETSENDSNAYELDSATIDAILVAVLAGDHDELLLLLEPLHAADIADLLEQISPRERAEFLTLWGHRLDADVLSELDEGLRSDILDHLPDELVAHAVKELDTDDLVDLVEDMEAPQQALVLEALEEADRVAVEQSLQFPEDSAGRLMQRELVMAPTHWSVGNAIDHLREATDLPDPFYHIIIVDPRMKPIGKVPLSRIMATKRTIRLTELMEEDLHAIPVDQPEEDVAYAFNQYHMVSAPVIDAEGRLVGMITIDDAMDVLDGEAEEDIMRLAGVGDESLHDNVVETTRQRFPWLAVNLVTAILASVVISLFSATIEAIVALAVLMPIVASMGGNAGTQALTVAVRALATKDLTAANAWRVIRREISVGLLNGLVFAVIIGIVGVIWFGSAMLGVVLGLAMIVNLLVAGMAGILVPLSLDRLGVDPALASGAFVTTVTDVIGFFAFLGLAAALLL